MRKLLVFAGGSNRPLAEEISNLLGKSLGEVTIKRFADGETWIQVEDSVRDVDVFIIQSTCSPVNDNLMELLIMIDAMRRASAERVTAVIPYYGYARQEKKTTGREPISAKLVANLITAAGADRVLTIDLHAPAIEGFFDIPVDHLPVAPILAEYFRETLPIQEVVVVAPDVGTVARANRFRKLLGRGLPLAVLFKHRPEPDMAEVEEMVGDVKGKSAIIVDDLISTGGTLIEGAKFLIRRGAERVYACATHPVFAPGAVERLEESPIEKVVVTNTIHFQQKGEKIEVVSVAPLLARAIKYINEGLSMTTLYKELKPIKFQPAL
jgi:ribose-phosphate pyrophosphokinase